MKISRAEQAALVKTKVLMYFRFERGLHLCCTEHHNADVVASDGEYWNEVEVKVNWSDFLDDWKKRKHEYYMSRDLGSYHNIPNRFFFAAPPELAERIAAYLKERKISYGVIAVSDGECHPFQAPDHCRQIKMAVQIHKEALHPNAIRSMVQRMSFEIITMRQRQHANGGSNG